MSGTEKVAIEALRIIDSGKYTYGQNRDKGYLDDDVMDCSEFVYHAYRKAGFLDFPALNSHSMALSFTKVVEPAAGDIVYWKRGHVGIVEDPEKGTFLGAQSKKSGLRRDNYKKGWWANQGGMTFFRYGRPSE
jgi:cell wall-associated NlpC family hydrolase